MGARIAVESVALLVALQGLFGCGVLVGLDQDYYVDAGRGGGTAQSAYRSAVLADHPAAYWRLDDASLAEAADQTQNHRTGKYMGAIELGAPGALTGDPDAAAKFVDTSAEVDFGDHFDFPMRAPFSLEAWIRPEELAGAFRTIVTKEGSGASGALGYQFYVEQDGRLAFQRWEAGKRDQILGSTTPIKLSVYTYVVATYDGEAESLYQDGVLVGSAPSTASMADVPDALVVGKGAGGFVGFIDEVAVYAAALSKAQVMRHYQSATQSVAPQ